jgi:sec-independent protein translocase protein TatC
MMGPLGWIEMICLLLFTLLVFCSHYVLKRICPNLCVSEDGAEDKTVRISLRQRLRKLPLYMLYMVAGLAVAFPLCFSFATYLYKIVVQPLNKVGIKLIFFDLTNPFTIYLKTATLFTVYLGSPWIFYLTWRFIAPALRMTERRWAWRFVIGCTTLFVGGGLFAYFVIFPPVMSFLLGNGLSTFFRPQVLLGGCVDCFLSLLFGTSLLFIIPAIVYFLAVLRIASPNFVLAGRRFILPVLLFVAAVVSPTDDAFNLMVYFLPMCLFLYLGVFACYATDIPRESHGHRWRSIISGISLLYLDISLAAISALTVDYFLVRQLHLEL